MGPPAAAATLAATAADASGAAGAVVGAAAAAVDRANALSSLSVLLGGPVGLRSLPAAVPTPQPAGRARRLAVETAPCAELLDGPCTGSVTLDTNLSNPDATVAPAGTYFDLRFSSLSGRLLGQQMAFNGGVRMELRSSMNLNATVFRGIDMRVCFNAFSGSINGETFGALTECADFVIDSQGNGTVTAGGARYAGLGAVDVLGDGAYTLTGTRVVQAHWSQASGHVELNLQDWRSSGNRPVVGSRATLTASGGSVTVTVSASSSARVDYAVVFAIGGVTTRYTVTASYPAGGGAPSYVAVPTPG